MGHLALLAACLAVLGVLTGLLHLSQFEFWWEFPKERALLLVGLYWAAWVTAGMLGAVGAWVLLTGSVRRIFGLAGLAVCTWLTLLLSGESVRASASEFKNVASGKTRPADVRYIPETGVVEIRGDLNFGSAARFKQVLHTSPDARLVDVGGPGGYIVEAKHISRMIEERNLDTAVTTRCASACVDIFASGVQRLMLPHALVGLHSASTFAGDEEGVAQENQAFFERLHRIGVEPRFLTIGTDTPAEELWVNTARQAYLAGLATAVVDQIPRRKP